MSFFEGLLPMTLVYWALLRDIVDMTGTRMRGFIAGYTACLICLMVFSNAFPSAARYLFTGQIYVKEVERIASKWKPGRCEALHG